MSGGRNEDPIRVELRPAVREDCRRIWLWRNDPETRRASFDSSPIPFETHEAWFQATLGSRDRRLYVILVGGFESGVVRLDVTGQEAEVSIHLAAEWRSRGVGPAALRTVADLAFQTLGLERLLASIKPDNRASLAAFRKAGFALAGEGEVLRLSRVRR